MTTIYGSDGASTGHSRDNPALRAKPTSPPELREIPSVNDEQASVSEISDDQFAARGALDLPRSQRKASASGSCERSQSI